MEEESIVRWHIYFSGEVQAVGFRFTAMNIARDLGITGWVRNLPDGRVEMEAQGSKARLTDLLIALKTHPPIHIEDYHIQPIPLKEEIGQFRITG